MDQAGISLGTRALAMQLVALEAASAEQSDAATIATCRVCEKLRRPLITLAGTAGFVSLLSRALTLAQREASALDGVHVRLDGSLEGLEGDAAKAHPVLVAYLLGLLNIFIGEALTLRLLKDVWPDLSGTEQSFLGKDSNESK